MKVVVSLALLILLILGGTLGQTDLGPGIAVYQLKVVEDVTLESASTNYNYLQYLITSYHPGYILKSVPCSDLRTYRVDANQSTMQ